MKKLGGALIALGSLWVGFYCLYFYGPVYPWAVVPAIVTMIAVFVSGVFIAVESSISGG